MVEMGHGSATAQKAEAREGEAELRTGAAALTESGSYGGAATRNMAAAPGPRRTPPVIGRQKWVMRPSIGRIECAVP